MKSVENGQLKYIPFLVNDTTHSSEQSLRFRKNLMEKNALPQIRNENVEYDL